MEIPTNVKVIDWRTSILWFDDDGVLYSCPKANAVEPELSREETLIEMKKFRETIGIAEGQKLCMVLETNSNSRAPKKEDRDFIAEQLTAITKAMAVISTSPLSRMIANLFFGLKPPPYPVKFFSNQKEAKEWIKQYV